MTTSDGTLDLQELLDVCVEVAERAGAVISYVRASGELCAVNKKENDPVTRADFAAQTLIFGTLRRMWPDLALVGEEDEAKCGGPAIDELLKVGKEAKVRCSDAAERARMTVSVPETQRRIPVKELCVYVDPLDATREYTHGSTEPVMVLIGITRNEVPFAAVTHQPFVDPEHGGRTLSAVVGVGTCEEMHPGKYSDQGKGTLVIMSVLTGDEAAERKRISLGADHAGFVGGCANKMLHVVEGRASFMMNSGCFVWDTCAVEAFARTCGGVVTDLNGNDLVYSRKPAPNSNGVFVSMLSREEHLAYLKRFHDNEEKNKADH